MERDAFFTIPHDRDKRVRQARQSKIVLGQRERKFADQLTNQHLHLQQSVANQVLLVRCGEITPNCKTLERFQKKFTSNL
jgi:hypothetical protein